MNGYAPGLAFIEKLRTTWKWAIQRHNTCTVKTVLSVTHLSKKPILI